MVARVDRVLREELDLPDGLADPSVYVLDPATGTGSYLVEVLRRIEQTLRERGDDALAAHDVKQAAMERVIGFEILPAPFVVGHLQVGLYLQSIGAPLSDERQERAAIYLTNALTGWQSGTGEGEVQSILAGYPELLEERDQARTVKQKTPVLVVLGNPPYNAFAGISPDNEDGLVESYKKGLISDWGIKKFNLDDLYVRFFRMAERKIADGTGRGVVCFISNHSWLDDASFVVMRQSLLNSFDRFWIENMHGNRRISERAPDGRTSETVFAVRGFSPGIRQGVAITLMAKTGRHSVHPHVLYRDDLNAAGAQERREQLLESLTVDDFDAQYAAAIPGNSNRFSMLPLDVDPQYLTWPLLTELSAIPPINGLMEKRGGALIDIDSDALEQRMRMYYDPEVDWQTLEDLDTGLTRHAAGYVPTNARIKLQAAEAYDPQRLRRYAIRPFETRWAYYSGVSPLWNRPRPSLWEQIWDGNGFLLSRVGASKSPEGPPFYFVHGLSDDHLLSPDASCFALQLRPSQKGKQKPGQPALLATETPTIANLSGDARMYLSSVGIQSPDRDMDTASLIWMHALAIGYSSTYLNQNEDGIRGDWPRIPLPDAADRLVTSAGLGRQVAALLDTETPVPGVTAGTIRPELRVVGSIVRVGGGDLNPDAGDLAVTAGWGYGGRGGITMPGRGRAVERDFTPEERAQIEAGALALGLEPDEVFARLGETTFDVYLNDVACWRNVPVGVWEYTIGDYQVMKKWLSYREQPLLGRSLTADEAREVTAMARRISALLLLGLALDANYTAVKAATYAWSAGV